MKEENESQRMLAIASIIESPLCPDVRDDGEIHLIDEVANEHYGKFVGKNLILDNGPVGEEGSLIVPIRSIDSIYEGDVGYIHIRYKNGKITTHRMVGTQVEPNPIVFSKISYKHPNLNDHIEMIKKALPNCMDCLYVDVLNDRDMIDCYMLGRDGVVPLDPQQTNNVILSEVSLFLEREYHTVSFSNGLQKEERFTPKRAFVLEALLYLAKQRERNPFIDCIRRIPWDGVNRLDSFLYESGCRAPVLSKEDESWYLSTIMKSWLLGILERNLNPDYEPIPFVMLFMGEQGSQKSTICRKIGMKWYKSTHISFKDSKKFFENVQGSVLVELKESTQFAEDSVEQIKAFIDEVELNYRKSYAAESSQRAIRFSMAGTTNNQQNLRDSSGNRRMFPVIMTLSNAIIPPRNRSDEEILQMWAEALEMYNKGARWADGLYVKGKNGALDDRILAVQEMATEDTNEEDDLLTYLDNEYPDIGDQVWSYQIRDYLQGTAGYYGEDLQSISCRLGHHPEVYGFRLEKRTSVKVNGQWRTGRLYVRFSQPVTRRLYASEAA